MRRHGEKFAKTGIYGMRVITEITVFFMIDIKFEEVGFNKQYFQKSQNFDKVKNFKKIIKK